MNSSNIIRSLEISDKCSISPVMKQHDDRQKTARICVKRKFVSLNDKVFRFNKFDVISVIILDVLNLFRYDSQSSE